MKEIKTPFRMAYWHWKPAIRRWISRIIGIK